MTRLPLEQILLGHERPNMRIVSIKGFAQFLPTAPITTRQVAQNQFEHFTQQAQWLWDNLCQPLMHETRRTVGASYVYLPNLELPRCGTQGTPTQHDNCEPWILTISPDFVC